MYSAIISYYLTLARHPQGLAWDSWWDREALETVWAGHEVVGKRPCSCFPLCTMLGLLFLMVGDEQVVSGSLRCTLRSMPYLAACPLAQEHHPCQRLRGGGPEGDPAVVSEQRAGGLGRRRPPERHLPTMSTQVAISHPSSRPGSATSVFPDLSAHCGLLVGPRTPSSLPSAPSQPRGVEQPTLRAF